MFSVWSKIYARDVARRGRVASLERLFVFNDAVFVSSLENVHRGFVGAAESEKRFFAAAAERKPVNATTD